MMKTEPIAYIRTPFKTKFGIPRQSGLDLIESKIVFEKKYSSPEAVRGLEDFSHIWLIWGFSEVPEDGGRQLTVRPPRLGGNKRMGVFATRSPFRPNRLGLSSVRLAKISRENGRTVLTVTGADMTDDTPIYDVKPYLSFTDSHPDAIGGFADGVRDQSLFVEFPDEYKKALPEDLIPGLIAVLSEDPRPHYQDYPNRVYGFGFAGYEIKFTVENDTLRVCGIETSDRE